MIIKINQRALFLRKKKMSGPPISRLRMVIKSKQNILYNSRGTLNMPFNPLWSSRMLSSSLKEDVL
jgi:hypothetical protein